MKMANFTTPDNICIERQLKVVSLDINIDDFLPRFDVIETCKWISDNQYSKVCLQFPDDLLSASANIYEEIKNRVDVDLYILGDTSYANCCVDTVAAMHVEGDAIIHYGRSCFSKTNIPFFTVLPKKDLDVEATMLKLQQHVKSQEDAEYCLLYDPEYEHCKDELSKIWFQNNPQSYIAFVELKDKQDRFLGRLIKDRMGSEYPIDLLKKCICIYVGSAGQTAFNFTISVEAKEWYLFNPDSSSMEKMVETNWFKRRRFLVEKCKDANVVGILICKLAGDQTKEIISRLKKLCKINGKKSYIVSVGKPNVAKLANFPEIDIYVMIACPENDLYNNREFYKPIVYPFELEVALNSNRESYYAYHVTDYDDLLPGKRHHCEIDHIKESTDVSLVTGRIRETKFEGNQSHSTDLVEKQNWALENIGQNLQDRFWKGLEQKLGETGVKLAEEGRKGIALQYKNEPK